MRQWKRLAALAAASVVVFQVGSPPARAVPSNQVIVGTGTITPGIPGPSGGTQNTDYTFDGTAAGNFDTSAGTCDVHFQGSGTDSFAAGSGTGTFTCNGAASLTCNASYSRTGLFWTLSGTCDTGSAMANVQWACQTVWTTVEPVTSFGMVCDTLILS